MNTTAYRSFSLSLHPILPPFTSLQYIVLILFPPPAFPSPLPPLHQIYPKDTIIQGSRLFESIPLLRSLERRKVANFTQPYHQQYHRHHNHHKVDIIPASSFPPQLLPSALDRPPTSGFPLPEDAPTEIDYAVSGSCGCACNDGNFSAAAVDVAGVGYGAEDERSVFV